MKSFLNGATPIITTMLCGATEREIVEDADRARQDGTEAFCLSMEALEDAYKQRTALGRILDALSDKPVYLTNYLRSNKTEGMTWERIEDEMLMARELGATLLDIPGDMYAKADMELTLDPTAIEKQKALAEKLHADGGEVLFSSHVFRFLSKEAVLTIAEQQAARGADIAKIVTAATCPDELAANIETLSFLSRRLSVPFLFLCGGSHCRRHRLLGPLLGSHLFLTRANCHTGMLQPTIAEAQRVLAAAEWSKENL